jgi:hypothetical protein
VIFNDNVTFAGPAAIETDVVFKGNLTASAADSLLTFARAVNLDYGRTITLGNAVGDLITLKKGASILVADTPVLAAVSGDVTLAGTANAVLAAGRPYDATLDTIAEENYLGDKALTLRDQDITATGNLVVVGGGVLEVDDITFTAVTLTLQDGATLDFKDDNIANTSTPGSVALGAAGITVDGGNVDAQARLVAGGGAVTLAVSSISGSGTLSVAPELGSPIINVPASDLTISGVNLDLFNNGTLSITSGNTVRLSGGANPGKITLGDEVGTTVSNLSGRFLGTVDTLDSDADLSGAGIIRGPDETERVGAIGDISGHPDGGALTITSRGASSTLVTNGAQLEQ